MARDHYLAGVRPFADWTWVEMVVRSLQGLAMVAARQSRPERAFRLAGASARLRDAASVEISSIEQAELDRALALVRPMLGDTKASMAWAEGQALTLEEAVAYALRDDETDWTAT